MGKTKHYMALDFGIGASGAIAGAYDGKTLSLEEVHKFSIQSTDMLGVSHWDFPAMLINAKQGLYAYSARHGSELAGLGCSSWSADFGLLDKNGQLLANPVHQQDLRTEGAVERLHKIFPDRSLYQRTGVRARREGTLFQLFSMAQSNSPLLDKAVNMLLMADLVSYFLTGIVVQEYTLATTTGMYDMESRDWSRDIILGAHIPPPMMPEIVAPGTVIGTLLDSVASECCLGQIPVIAPASHGMASAVAATPDAGENWVAISAGYLNQITAELSEPVINDATFGADFSNMGGVDGSIRLQKEVPGMGPLEDCARVWSREDGRLYTLEDVLRMGEEAGRAEQVLDLEDPRLSTERDYPALFRRMLDETGQAPASTRGELVSVYLNSTVLAQAEAYKQLVELTGRTFDCVYFLGRGADSPLFCQYLADATGMPVRACHTQSKAIGNILMQMLALGELGSLADGRELAARSFPVAEYLPKKTAVWDELFATLYRTGKAGRTK